MIDRLPIPTCCDACESVNVIYASNEIIYGKEIGDWPRIYFCKDCKARVGCHPNTNYPLGKMANRKTRQLRVVVHESFDKIWQKNYLTRKEAYNKLASFLNIPEDECHISWLTDAQLIDAKLWAIDYLKNNPKSAKRAAKKYAKRLDQIARDSKHADRRRSSGKFRQSRSS